MVLPNEELQDIISNLTPEESSCFPSLVDKKKLTT